jgi:hypothetical protein
LDTVKVKCTGCGGVGCPRCDGTGYSLWPADVAPKPKAKIASDGGTTDYYKLPPHATELRHLISFKKMNFHIGNIFKAAYRLGEKDGIDHRYDLKKIISMAQFELEELDREEGKLA